MEDAFRLAVAFVTGPETNTIAQGFAGILSLMIGWKFLPMVLEHVPALGGDESGRRMVRGVLGFGLSIVLAIAAAAAVGMLAQRL